jgi:hypothetical protein
VSASTSAPAEVRSIERNIIVAVLSLFVLISTLPSLSLVWDQTGASSGAQGSFGFATDYDGLIKAVAPNSAAASAGLRPGDRIDLQRTSFESRTYIVPGGARAQAGRKVDVWVIQGDTERLASLVAPFVPYRGVARLNLIVRTLTTFVFVLVGGSLVILRPSTMTWGFFFYCLGFSPGIALGGFARFPMPAVHLPFILLIDVLSAAGTVGILVFALHFLSGDPAPWRRSLERSVPFMFVGFAMLIAYPDVANLVLGWPAESVQRIMLTLQGLVFALTIFAATQTYLHGRPQDRPRMQWVLVGLCIGIVGTYLGVILLYSSELPFNPPRWLQSAILSLNVCLPIAVAYAVIRHRVIEVSFVISRALIYAALTFIVLSLFAFVDWFVGRELEAVRVASYVEIAIAIGLSFWLNALEKRVETVVASVFFRTRHQAMLRLDRATEAVRHASKTSTVFDYLVREPVEALSLSSAALFLPADPGAGVDGFRRVADVGWSAASAHVIDHDDPLALDLLAEDEPLRVAEIGWHHDGIPTGNAAPILALPMVRRELMGIALYGPHTNGADIDPEEIRALFGLARAAEAAYDYLRALELEARLQELRQEVATLRTHAGEAAG